MDDKLLAGYTSGETGLGGEFHSRVTPPGWGDRDSYGRDVEAMTPEALAWRNAHIELTAAYANALRERAARREREALRLDPNVANFPARRVSQAFARARPRPPLSGDPNAWTEADTLWGTPSPQPVAMREGSALASLRPEARALLLGADEDLFNAREALWRIVYERCPYPLRSRMYVEIARLSRALGDEHEARTAWLFLLRDDRNDPRAGEANMVLAEEFFARGDWCAARPFYEHVVALAPGAFTALASERLAFIKSQSRRGVA